MSKKHYAFSLLFIGILSPLYAMKRSCPDDNHSERPHKMRRICNFQELINTDFLLAAQKGDLDKLISTLSHGADINITDDEYGMTALMITVHENNVECAEILCQKGANPTATDTMGMNAIDHATPFGNLNVLKLLILHGVPFDNADANGSTPLLKSVLQSDTNFVRFLLECGAKPNAFTKKYYLMPLMLATTNNSIPCICWLLYYGAKPDAENNWNKSACDIAPSPEAEKLLSDRYNSPIWKEFCRQRLAEKMGEKSPIHFLRNRELGKRIQK